MSLRSSVKTLSVAHRLGGGFGFVMLLVLAIAISGALALREVSRQLDQIVEVNNSRTGLANDLLNVINNMAIESRTVTLLTDMDSIDKENKQFEKSAVEYGRVEAALSKELAGDDSDDAGRKLFEEIKNIGIQALPSLKKAVALGAEGNNLEATSTLTTEVRPAETLWRAEVSAFLTLQKERSAQSVNDAHRSRTRAFTRDAILVLVAMLSGTAVALWVVRNNLATMAVIAEQNATLEQRVAERTEELHHQATHDELTGLLNRRAFDSEMMRMKTYRAGVEVSTVLCLVDLDHFKLVNDSFGHSAGDKVLRQVADILRRHTRSSDIVARMGGDEFAIILFDCSIAEAQAKMQRLEHDVHALVMEKEGKRVSIGMSAGLVMLSAVTCSEPDQAMANADSACYAAKQGGRHQARVFDANAAPMRRMNDINWLSVIDSALEEDRLLLYAQPIMTSSNGTVRTIEVLVRMLLSGDIIAPNQFLPAAERHGLMPRIDTWVVSHTLDFLGAHPDAVDQFDTVHINLSASTICDLGYYRLVVRKLREHASLRTKLCFEITESAPIDRLEIAVRIMNGLRRRGVQFALDDFGHGMASFTYLQTLPVDCVKIDGSFVRDMMKNPLSDAIVRSINDIAHLGGMRTVAEFVEDASTSKRLTEMGVDYQQGYHIARPQPIEQVATTASFMRKVDATNHMEETLQISDLTSVQSLVSG